MPGYISDVNVEMVPPDYVAREGVTATANPTFVSQEEDKASGKLSTQPKVK
jgi:hypothetical protein